MLRINKENFEDEKLQPEFFPTTRQSTKRKNTFANNMWTDTMVQSDGSFGFG